MPFRTKLPPGTSLFRRLTYPPVRSAFYFFFGYLAYRPVRRVNKPSFDKPFIWASSHSNFLCDAIHPGFEAHLPTRFLAKSTLFVFPIKQIIEFCGALPVARAQDLKSMPREERMRQNRETFKVAIAEMKKGWPVAIFPEGVSLDLPGLFLPLKPGVAKIAFAAEQQERLGLQIIPVGLEYGSRTKVGSGLTIRYGNPLDVNKYIPLIKGEDDSAAVTTLMSDLTKEMISVFPHFEDEHKMKIGKKLVAIGLSPTKHAIAQLFLKKKADPEFWEILENKLKQFEEQNKEIGLPLPVWGYRKRWREHSQNGRRVRILVLILGTPFGILELFNNTLPEFCLKSLVDYVAVDETEKMSLRFIASPIVLGLVFGIQFLFLKRVVFEFSMIDASWGLYFVYFAASFVLWYVIVYWKRQLKAVTSLMFFRRYNVGKDSSLVKCYKELRNHVGELHDDRRKVRKNS